MLTTVFPALEHQWKSYLEVEYQHYNQARIDYVDIGEINRYIVDKKKRNDTSGFDEFFNRVELILTYGDSYTRELIVIGLLEGIQKCLRS